MPCTAQHIVPIAPARDLPGPARATRSRSHSEPMTLSGLSLRSRGRAAVRRKRIRHPWRSKPTNRKAHRQTPPPMDTALAASIQDGRPPAAKHIQPTGLAQGGTGPQMTASHSTPAPSNSTPDHKPRTQPKGAGRIGLPCRFSVRTEVRPHGAYFRNPATVPLSCRLPPRRLPAGPCQASTGRCCRRRCRDWVRIHGQPTSPRPHPHPRRTETVSFSCLQGLPDRTRQQASRLVAGGAEALSVEADAATLSSTGMTMARSR